MTDFKKILIIRLSAVGDVINVLPALRSLRSAYPAAYIAWLVDDRAEGILCDNPDLDDIFIFPRKGWQKSIKKPFRIIPTLFEAFAFFKSLNHKEFDLVIDFHGNLKSGLMAMFSGKCVKLGFDRKSCKEWNHLFTNLHVSLENRRIHRIDKNLNLLKPLGIDTKYIKPQITVSDNDKGFIADFLAKSIDKEKPLVVIHPGTSKFGEFKRWPTGSYARFADMLIKSLSVSIVFTWGGPEIEIVREIVSKMEEKAVISCKTRSLKQLVELIGCSNLFISGDTGPMHMASIMEKRVVAIFGPKDPIIYGPYSYSKNLNADNLKLRSPVKTVRVVRKDLGCSPCKKRKCSKNVCITSVSPDEVFQAASELLTIDSKMH